MEATGAVRKRTFSAARAEDAMEAAVNRLTDSGRTRTEALLLINKTLYEVIPKLHIAGIKQTAFLEQQHLAARTALTTIRVREANEDDAKHGG